MALISVPPNPTGGVPSVEIDYPAAPQTTDAGPDDVVEVMQWAENTYRKLNFSNPLKAYAAWATAWIANLDARATNAEARLAAIGALAPLTGSPTLADVVARCNAIVAAAKNGA